MKECPYKIGDWVIFRPSERWLGWNQLEPLKIGKAYKITDIQKFQGEDCLAVDGSSPQNWFIFWEEFQPMQKCPFKIGDTVIYMPSERGRGWDIFDSLETGKAYKIMEIQKENYLVIEGYSHPGGGLYWTEFQPDSKLAKQRSNPNQKRQWC